MNHLVEDSIANDSIPLVDGQLAGYQCGTGLIVIVHKVHKVIDLCGVEGIHAPVIEDKQSGFDELMQEFVIAAVGLGVGEDQEQAG